MSWWKTSFLIVGLVLSYAVGGQAVEPDGVKDLSLLVAPTHPCVWPVGMTQHLVIPSRVIGPGAYHRDLIVIDEHTGTQWDAPAHFVPPPDSGLPGAGPMGLITGDKVPVWQFVGEACVIDVRAAVDRAPAGHSFLIGPEMVAEWEEKHRPLGPGDVVLFRSDYSDRYYLPLAQGGERFVHTALRGETPGWPAPNPQCMEYLARQRVTTLGLDGASMGPLPDLAVATHQAGGKHGLIWTECATNLGSLPPTGAFVAMLAPKHAGGSGNESRLIAITEPRLAAKLIASARAKRVVDLSVVLDEDYPITWPGQRPGDEASRYVAKTLNAFSKTRGPYFARTHMLDGQVGTHAVPPSYSLPPENFPASSYSQEIQTLLQEFEAKFGARGHSRMTVEQLPLHLTLGEAHPVDVRQLVGSTRSDSWPASPVITVELLKDHEQKVRPFAAGEVVIFYSGYSDEHFRALPELPEVDQLFSAPLAGKAEGWPAPSPEAVVYLAEKGIRCIGTDGPTLGGADPKQALWVYWAAASRGVIPVEYLTNVGQLPSAGAFFLFAPVKIQGSHGGYGRAMALK